MDNNKNGETRLSTIEVDDSPDAENDSAYDGSSVGSASYQSSISSSVKNYKYENGRRYHAFHEGAYALPNDDEEQDRMDFLHHIYRLLLGGKLYEAPVPDDVHRVLDLGTGTAIWAIDYADEHPSAQVIGMDLSPIQPSWVPPNCIFEVDDFEADWPYSHSFDFIHGRELLGSVSDYDRLFKQAFDHLKPGGYLEMETAGAKSYSDDGTNEKAVAWNQWLQHLCDASEKFGKSVAPAMLSSWKERMENAGFVDVTQKIYKLPLNPWPKDPKLKELGRYQQVQQLQAIVSYGLALFSRVLGWSKEEIDLQLEAVRKNLKDRSIHNYIQIHIVYGRKP